MRVTCEKKFKLISNLKNHLSLTLTAQSWILKFSIIRWKRQKCVFYSPASSFKNINCQKRYLGSSYIETIGSRKLAHKKEIVFILTNTLLPKALWTKALHASVLTFHTILTCHATQPLTSYIALRVSQPLHTTSPHVTQPFLKLCNQYYQHQYQHHHQNEHQNKST